MLNYPKISIVTPSFNDVKYIELTILSVVNQGYPNLEYIIIDGGSDDGSVDIIKKYESKITYWVTEKDKGMYHALRKGFAMATGEIMGWINSDDQYQSGCLFTIAQIFSDFENIHWIQGTPTVIDESGRMFTDSHRFEVDKFFFYNREHARTHKFIQQESTFWRRSLWMKAGQNISIDYKYAGDFELWIRFFQFEKIFHIDAILGSFRRTRSGQASQEHYKEYLEETFAILKALPLTSKEKVQLAYLRILEKMATYFEKSYLFLKKKFRPLTLVKNTLYFDPREQKLKRKR